MSLGGKSDYELKEIHRENSIAFRGNNRVREEAERELKGRGYINRDGISWEIEEEEEEEEVKDYRTPEQVEADREFTSKLLLTAVSVICLFYLYNVIPTLMFDSKVNQFSQLSIKTSYMYILGYAGLGFLSLVVLFYWSTFLRFYTSILGIVIAYGWYGNQTYNDNGVLEDPIITIGLLGLLILSLIPKVNYYIKCSILATAPLLGIYLTYTEYAMTWVLMIASSLLLFFSRQELKR